MEWEENFTDNIFVIFWFIQTLSIAFDAINWKSPEGKYIPAFQKT